MVPRPHLTIDSRFNGPIATANGGYVGGSLARILGARSVEVTLRAPPPLDHPLELRELDGGGIALYDDGTLLVEARAMEFDLDIPTLPTLGEAEAAGALGRIRAASRTGNPYGQCFGCGIARSDGLRLVPSPIGDTGIVACTWTPDAAFATAERRVTMPVVWTALDCPAGFAWQDRLPDTPALLTGRISARIDTPPVPGERYLVAAWPIRREGRKLFAGSAIVDAAGAVRARSLQVWLIPRD